MSLDLAVASAVHGALVLERALHEHHGWGIEVDGMRVPAVRTVEHDGVVFSSVLPELRLRARDGLMTLLHRGVPQIVRPFELQGDGPFDVVFELRLVDPVSV